MKKPRRPAAEAAQSAARNLALYPECICGRALVLQRAPARTRFTGHCGSKPLKAERHGIAVTPGARARSAPNPVEQQGPKTAHASRRRRS